MARDNQPPPAPNYYSRGGDFGRDAVDGNNVPFLIYPTPGGTAGDGSIAGELTLQAGLDQTTNPVGFRALGLFSQNNYLFSVDSTGNSYFWMYQPNASDGGGGIGMRQAIEFTNGGVLTYGDFTNGDSAVQMGGFDYVDFLVFAPTTQKAFRFYNRISDTDTLVAAIAADTGFVSTLGTTSTSLAPASICLAPAKAGAPADTDFTNPQDGLVAIDSTDARIYVRYGGAWHYAALT